MTATEYAEISGRPQPNEISTAEKHALIAQARRALAVRRAIAVREIEEQAAALDEHDRQRIFKALGGVS
jgi:hypothetical protein